MSKYHNLTLAITKKGKVLLYNDPEMLAINNQINQIEQTFPLHSKIAAQGLLRDYSGKYMLEVQKTLKEALALF